MRIPLITLVILLPALAGCFSGDDAAAEEAPSVSAAASAEAAGARSGVAPAAAKDAYVVADPAATAEARVAYPAALPTNPAREPLVVDLSGEFAPEDCVPVGVGSAVSQRFRWTDLSDNLEVGDVFAYNITFSYQNTDAASAEIHPGFGMGSTVEFHSDPVRELDEVLISWEGQGYRGGDDDLAWVAVQCWWGVLTQPIPYTLTVTFTFAEGAIPAEAPVLVRVPENVTTLFVRGVAIDDARGVLSHYRLFDPQDDLVCECQLSSNQEVAEIPVPGPGEYVLLVDHTANGFVSVAMDAPTTDALAPLDVEWIEYPLYTDDASLAPTATVTVDLPTVPLFMNAWPRVTGEPPVGVGKKMEVVITNARGEVLRQAWGGHVTFQVPGIWTQWWGIWPTDWARAVDHHAFDYGEHQVQISGEAFRGELTLFTRQYVR